MGETKFSRLIGLQPVCCAVVVGSKSPLRFWNDAVTLNSASSLQQNLHFHLFYNNM